MNKVKSDITTLEEMVVEEFGLPGTEKREDYERGLTVFKLSFMIKEARLKQGFTQEQLAEKIGTTKSYISKVENDVNEIRLSTLRKIIEGLGGRVEVTFTFGN